MLFFNNPDKEDSILNRLNEIESVEAKSVFRSVGIGGIIIRKIHLTMGLPFRGIWLLNWLAEIDKYHTVICIATQYSEKILRTIHFRNPRIRLINYFWDCVEISKYPVPHSKIFENWSFNRRNCLQYGMQYNPQFYAETNLLPKNNIKYDAVFVGADRNGLWKTRAKMVQHYYEEFSKQGITTFFWFVTNAFFVAPQIKKKRLLTQEQYYHISACAKAVLDIVEPDCAWMTLRPLLAMTNQKKLITNNREILKERFYSKENVFVLGIDRIEDLNSFIESPFTPIAPDCLAYYEASQWLNRFFEKGAIEGNEGV